MLTLLTVLACVAGMALAYWAGARTKPKPVPVVDTDPILARARVLTADAELMQASGEAKRHRVYARLIKEYPDVPKRTLARAIEDAL